MPLPIGRMATGLSRRAITTRDSAARPVLAIAPRDFVISYCVQGDHPHPVAGFGVDQMEMQVAAGAFDTAERNRTGDECEAKMPTPGRSSHHSGISLPS
jgi:hypothetical protein